MKTKMKKKLLKTQDEQIKEEVEKVKMLEASARNFLEWMTISSAVATAALMLDKRNGSGL